MSEIVKIKMVGDWSKTVGMTLGGAINATYDICGRSLAEACKHAIILMAQSARAMTPQARKNRKIERDEQRRPFFAKYKQGQPEPVRWYLPSRKADPDGYQKAMNDWRPIGNRGLAKRSWMWGLAGLRGVSMDRRPIPGVGSLRRILTDKVGGFILSNRLSYLLKIMPGGWEESVRQKAINKIMKQAQMRLERQWIRAVKNAPPSAFIQKPDLAKYILRAS